MQQKFLSQVSLFAFLLTSLSYATTSKEILFSDQTTYTTITTQTTISTPGHYLLGNNLSISSGDAITINASDVVLDLDKRVIDGSSGGTNGVTIASGNKNIIVGNGIIRSMSSNGILVQSDQCTIIHCDCNQNATGFSVSSANNVVIDDCQAIANTSNGFSLSGCAHTIVRNSTALNTGSTGSAFGFISAGGEYNIFDSCIAHGTNTHTPPGFAHAAAHAAHATAHEQNHQLKSRTPSSIAVGFMLDTTEFGSSIVNCKSDDTTTPTGDDANPYGINLGTTFDGTLNKLTASTYTNGLARAIAWNADGSLCAIGGDRNGDEDVGIYRFNGKRLNLLTTDSDGSVTYAVDWSPNGSYLAVGSSTGLSGFTIKVYVLVNDQLQFVCGGDDFTQINTLHWSSDAKYLATGDTSGLVTVYSFDGDLLAPVTTVSFGASVNTVRWSPTGNLAIGGPVSSGADIQVYSFSGSSLTLQATANQGAAVNSLDWSTDGNYLAVGADPSSGIDTQIYSYNGSTLTLTDSASHGASVRSVHFSPNNRYLATTGDTESTNNSEINLYSFSAGSLTSLGFTVFGNNTYASAWAPHQRYFGVAGDLADIDPTNGSSIHDVRIYQLGLDGVANCTVKNNTVTNTTGSFNTGIGIRADSLNNHIVDNHALSNDISYQYTTNINAQGLFSSPTRLQNIGIPPR